MGTTGGGRHQRHAANTTAAAAAVMTKLNMAARESDRRLTIRTDDLRGELIRSPDGPDVDLTGTEWDRSTKTTGPSQTSNGRFESIDTACSHPRRNSDNTERWANEAGWSY